MKGAVLYHAPVGNLLLEYEDGAVTALKNADEPLPEETPNPLTALVCDQLDAYFAGTRTAFDFPCRAVGMTNHSNPIFIAIPCHRVIGADGSLTGYGGGLAMKRALLAMEAENAKRRGK